MTAPIIKISRRQFIILAGGAASASVLGASALAFSGLQPGAEQSDIHYPEPSFGESTMNNPSLLVAYTSQAGSTAEVAAAIGKTLSDSGARVDVRRMNSVTDLTSYQAVVVGSAIHGQKWLPEAMQFMWTYRDTLAQKPFAAFMVCITLGMANASRYRDGLSAWMDPIRSIVQPVSVGLFAGSLDFSKLPVTLDTIGLRIAVSAGILPKGDHRDWDAIRAWAAEIYPKLTT